MLIEPAKIAWLNIALGKNAQIVSVLTIQEVPG